MFRLFTGQTRPSRTAIAAVALRIALSTLFALAVFAVPVIATASPPVASAQSQRLPEIIAELLARGRPQQFFDGHVSLAPVDDSAATKPRSCSDYARLQQRIDDLYAASNELSRRITDAIGAVLDGEMSIDELWQLYDEHLAVADELEALLSIDVDRIDRVVRVDWRLPRLPLLGVRVLYFRSGNQQWSTTFGQPFTAVFDRTRELSAGRTLLPWARAEGGGLGPGLHYEFASSWRQFCEEREDRGVAFVELATKGRIQPLPLPLPLPPPPLPPTAKGGGYRLYVRIRTP